MTTYLLAYRAPADFAPGDPDAPAAWGAFFGKLGPNMIDSGNPIFTRESLGETGAGTIISGYSVINAGSLDEALALAGGCPLIGAGGGVEVGEMTLLDPVSMELIDSPQTTAA